MRNLESLSATFMKNMKSIYTIEDRKDIIKRQSIQLKGSNNFNPRVARYRSHRGLPLSQYEKNLNLIIQITPIILLATILIAKIFI